MQVRGTHFEHPAQVRYQHVPRYYRAQRAERRADRQPVGQHRLVARGYKQTLVAQRGERAAHLLIHDPAWSLQGDHARRHLERHTEVPRPERHLVTKTQHRLAGARHRRLTDVRERKRMVGRLQCLRGVSTLTAFGLAVEVGDWHRFTGSTIGSFLGLVPTERSSGGSRSQGSITKTGNTHARRLLVEAAWHHRRPYRTPSTALRDRWEAAPAAARARGHAGNQRLHRRWETFTERKKRPTIANVARELAGWCWSLAVMDTGTDTAG